ncbi:transposase [Azospirillum brasilense]|uniref:Transposase n=1 Tax=Azospirillum brasilense TaxID=192 RepID=A0A4D8RFR3_AZOBR|nr:transposase [Azospirillum brasilense]
MVRFVTASRDNDVDDFLGMILKRIVAEYRRNFGWPERLEEDTAEGPRAMGQPYSADLRERVLLAYERHEGGPELLARRFQISRACAYNWVRAARLEGRRVAKPHAGGVPAKLDAEGVSVLRALVREDNDATLAQYRDRLAARTGIALSPAVVCRTLKRLGLARKKRR